MFEYVSDHYKMKGPAVEAKFFLEKGKIFEIQLNLNKESSLSWQILSDKKDPVLEKHIKQWMQDYAKKKDPTVDLPLDFNNLPSYSLLVLKRIHKIGFGKTLSYRDLAIQTGKPRGARAVGNACGRNPFPLVIPCHRVLASDGKIGGYSGGLEVKKLLLTYESAG